MVFKRPSSHILSFFSTCYHLASLTTIFILHHYQSLGSRAQNCGIASLTAEAELHPSWVAGRSLTSAPKTHTTSTLLPICVITTGIMREKTVGKSFRKINLTHTDDFGQKNDKIRLWVINNGGTFSKELNNEVTHLVCSKKAWKEYKDIGKLASFYPAPIWSHLSAKTITTSSRCSEAAYQGGQS